jgi:arylsulfatase
MILLLACTGEEPPAPPAQPAPPTVMEPQGAGHTGLKATPTFELVGEAAATPTSIVIISLDTVRADRLAVYGGRAQTPVMSAFAARGTRFDQAISHFPETALSHWSMLSGVLPEVHGNVPASGGSRYTGPTLAELTARHGYATAAFIGGVTLTDQSSGLSRGFETYDDQFPLDAADMKRPGAQVTAAAAAWIREQSGPYFAFVHYFDAHFPYTPAPPWDTAYDPDYAGDLTGSDADLRPYRDGGRTPSPEDLAHVLALYDGELSELDALLAGVLEAAGPDAIVVITADHGESFEHDYYFNHRAGLWDGVLRVPWLIAGPGVPAGQVIPSQVGLIDVTPTVLALAGLPADARMQGRARLTDTAHDPDGVVFSITDPWMPQPQFARRTLAEKCIQQPDRTLRYDLLADPAETSALDGPDCARDGYARLIAALSGSQVPEPQTGRALSDEECARLEALGYTTCQEPGPPGPPPGQHAPGQQAPGQHAPGQTTPGQRPPGRPPGTPPPKNPPR